MTSDQQQNNPAGEFPGEVSTGASNNRPEKKFYEIHVKGQLDRSWSDWLEGFELKLVEDGEMVLTGSVSDQAALMGILNKLNRLNLPLISVNEVRKTMDQPSK